MVVVFYIWIPFLFGEKQILFHSPSTNCFFQINDCIFRPQWIIFCALIICGFYFFLRFNPYKYSFFFICFLLYFILNFQIGVLFFIKSVSCRNYTNQIGASLYWKYPAYIKHSFSEKYPSHKVSDRKYSISFKSADWLRLLSFISWKYY